MVQTANTIWRDFTTDGVPSSGKNDPDKADIREWGTYVEDALLPTGLIALPTLALQPEIVLIVTGQSNADGSGSGGDMTTNANVLAWNGTSWVVADPTKAPFPANSNNNFGFHAAKYLQEVTGRTVRIILVAEGGVAIERWIADDADHHLWTEIETDVPAALAAAGLSYVDRVLWHQGEANNTTGAIQYRDKLITVKDQMRAESWWLDGHTFMLAGEMVDSPLNARGTTFAIRLAAEIDRDIGVVPSFGIEAKAGEEIHFSGAGLVEYGKRYGQMCMLPYAPVMDMVEARHARSNIYFYLELDGSGDFDNLQEAIQFFSTVTFGPSARGIVAIGEGQWAGGVSGLRTSFVHGSAWEFTGVLAGDFAQPVKADFTGTKATDLAMLQGKYLTEIAFTSEGIILGGNNGGRWNDLLLTASAPTLQACGIRSSDPNLPKADGLSYIETSNVAIHGWDGITNRAIYMENASRATSANLTISHCAAGVLVIGNGVEVSCNNAVVAYVTDAEFQAINCALISANSAKIEGFVGISFNSTFGARINAVGADNNTPSTISRDGVVWT